MHSTDTILFFYEGIGKRIALLSDVQDIQTIIITVEERTTVQHRVNTYARYYVCIPVFDYDERRVKLLAGLAHHPIISKVLQFCHTIPRLWKSHDLYIRVHYKEWTFAAQSNIDAQIHLMRKIPGLPCLFETPSYDEMKTAIIAWRESLGETIQK